MGDKSISNRDWSGTGREENVNGKQKHPIKDFPEEAAAKKRGPDKLRQMQRSYKKGGKV